MKLVISAIIFLIFATASQADVFMKLFMERAALSEAFDLKYSTDCIAFSTDNLPSSLSTCNKALNETATIINAGNRHVQPELYGLLAMEYLARSEILERLGRQVESDSDCTDAVKYARLIGDSQKSEYFRGRCLR